MIAGAEHLHGSELKTLALMQAALLDGSIRMIMGVDRSKEPSLPLTRTAVRLLRLSRRGPPDRQLR